MAKKSFFGITVLAMFLAAVMTTDVSAQMRGRMMDGMNGGMMGGGMMMGKMGMMPGCMLGGEDVDVEVKDLDDGVAITLRSSDKDTARMLQLRGEMMRIMQEMMELR